MASGATWVVVEEGAVCGTISVARNMECAYINGMAVPPSQRGRGLGPALLDKSISYAEVHNCESDRPSTTPFLKAAIAPYRASGFTVDHASRKSDLHEKPLIHMTKYPPVVKGN
ncbi:hypothetical protein GCM10011609_76280 [Lentzea pudingi]|uniref:N-acetyltransferase domain-containing protein n=2 Tax=Lentzea pudingi TaxID=1789439 RepID=A0ABQ2IQB1_9PSEU|nr:hypothetical protein GCM10011609_76280 [Lentzea pudingi]